MSDPVQVVGRAFRIWWDEFVVMLALNAVWFLLQLPVITAAPATAAVYALARRSYQGDYWGPREAWAVFRRLFWPAWRWGLLNLAILLVVAVNLTTFWRAPGTIWQLLRPLWALGALFWLALNLFYWPFWLAQEDKRMRVTYTNCVRFLLLNTWPALVLIALCGLLAVVSFLTAAPLGLALMCWLALIGVAAVQQSLTLQEKD